MFPPLLAESGAWEELGISSLVFLGMGKNVGIGMLKMCTIRWHPYCFVNILGYVTKLHENLYDKLCGWSGSAYVKLSVGFVQYYETDESYTKSEREFLQPINIAIWHSWICIKTLYEGRFQSDIWLLSSSNLWMVLNSIWYYLSHCFQLVIGSAFCCQFWWYAVIDCSIQLGLLLVFLLMILSDKTVALH